MRERTSRGERAETAVDRGGEAALVGDGGDDRQAHDALGVGVAEPTGADHQSRPPCPAELGDQAGGGCQSGHRGGAGPCAQCAGRLHDWPRQQPPEASTIWWCSGEAASRRISPPG